MEQRVGRPNRCAPSAGLARQTLARIIPCAAWVLDARKLSCDCENRPLGVYSGLRCANHRQFDPSAQCLGNSIRLDAMCTLIAIHRLVPGAPLVVAANRDEYLDRPTEGLAVRMTPAGAILAPRDMKAGGTWLGLNAKGVFAAVTNRRSQEQRVNCRSRGLLVLDALAEGSARRAVAGLARLAPRAYSPFNLFVADDEHAFAITYEDRAQLRSLEPGIHVIGSVDPNQLDDPKVARVFDRTQKAVEQPPSRILDEMAAVCREHDAGDGPLGDVCVHTETYGTRSSFLLRLSESEGETCVLFADGPPCNTEFEDFTDLVAELSRMASYELRDQATRNAT